MARSKLPEMMRLPFGVNATECTAPESPVSGRSNCPLPDSQSLIDLSKLPEISVCPLGEKATDVTTPACPGRVSRRWPKLREPQHAALPICRPRHVTPIARRGRGRQERNRFCGAFGFRSGVGRGRRCRGAAAGIFLAWSFGGGGRLALSRARLRWRRRGFGFTARRRLRCLLENRIHGADDPVHVVVEVLAGIDLDGVAEGEI